MAIPDFRTDGFLPEGIHLSDVDAVILLPLDFEERLREFDSVAWELRDCAHYGEPAELFLAQTDDRWLDWVSYFSKVRGVGDVRKGLIEVRL